MFTWKTRVKLGDLHQRWREKAIDVQAVAAELAQRLAALQPTAVGGVRDAELDELVEELRSFATKDPAELSDEPTNVYDKILGRVYDWGDQDCRLWLQL